MLPIIPNHVIRRGADPAGQPGGPGAGRTDNVGPVQTQPARLAEEVKP